MAHNPYTRLEEQYGVQCDFYQFIHIEGLNAKEFRQQRVNPADYTAVILNSKLGADHYFRLCEELRFNVPESMHYYCVSDQVGLYLQKYIQYRKRKVFFPEGTNKFEDLLPAMHRRPNEKYLMVLSDIHNDDQINMFAANNITLRLRYAGSLHAGGSQVDPGEFPRLETGKDPDCRFRRGHHQCPG